MQTGPCRQSVKVAKQGVTFIAKNKWSTAIAALEWEKIFVSATVEQPSIQRLFDYP